MKGMLYLQITKGIKVFHYGKVKVSNDQELLQLQHKSHPKYPCGKKEEKKTRNKTGTGTKRTCHKPFP